MVLFPGAISAAAANVQLLRYTTCIGANSSVYSSLDIKTDVCLLLTNDIAPVLNRICAKSAAIHHVHIL